MRQASRLVLLVSSAAIALSSMSVGIVAAAKPTTTTATPAEVIPPAPPATPPAAAKAAVRDDLVSDPLPAVPDTKGLSGQALAEALAKSDLGKPRDVRHKNPGPGDDPRDPATVRISTGAWLLFFLDSNGNLYEQLNPGTALDPYWQSGNVIVNGPVNHPDVARLDVGGTSTLGLFYLRTVGGTAQVMARASTTNGASWGTETQLTTGTPAAYWLRAIVDAGTTYLFWSDTAGNLRYRTSTDLSTWSTAAAVGHMVGPLSGSTYPSFDIAHLANGNWLLAYLDLDPSCYPSPCNTYSFPVLYTTVGTDLQNWGGRQAHTVPVASRWPSDMSLLQAPSGTIYLAYRRYSYPWADYILLQTGSSDGSTWSGDTTFGCDQGIGCDGWHDVEAINPYLFLDEQSHVEALWQMSAGPAGVSDTYPDQIFEADLTTGTYYRPLPPYMDPAVNYGAGSLGSGLVNVASGNLVVSESDYSLGGLGLPTTLTRTYNGGDTRDGIFGFGWSFPYAMGLQVNSGGSVTIANFDGRRDYYTESGGTYTAPPGLETTLVHNALGTWTLSYRDHTTKTFDSAGKLAALADADGNTTELTYVAGRLDTITDAAGRDFVLAYDANGRVSSISIPLSRSLGYTYDAAGNLLSFTDPSGAVTTTPTAPITC